MSIKKYLVIFLTVASLSPLSSVAERMALVMGNQAYTKTGVLVQPIADAELMVKAFQSRQIPLFEGKGHFDLTSLEMEELLARFAAKIRREQYEAVLLYYAGYGVQYNGQNYLIPVNIGLNSAAAVKHKAMSLSFVLDTLKEAGSKVNVVFLDACRNNPFRGTRGLARVAPPADTETLISYSTAANDVAADASPYTPTLARLIMTQPQLDIERLLKKVRAKVRTLSKGQQNPDYSSSFGDREFCFGTCGKSAVVEIDALIDPPKNVARLAFEPKMVKIGGGTFQMGSPASEKGRNSDETQHAVTVGDFWMAKTETTFNQWQACVDAGGCQSNKKPDDQGWGRGNRPVINVSWQDTQQYIQWLNKKTGKYYRLPTEAEWEHAARAGTTTAYSWGNSANHNQANYGEDVCCGGLKLGKDQWEYTAPVARFSANGFGLYDLHGNVWEWVQDKYEANYKKTPNDGSAWESTTGANRVFRGGSWYNASGYLRSANRNRFAPGDRFNNLGFRLVRSQEK